MGEHGDRTVFESGIEIDSKYSMDLDAYKIYK